MKSRILPPALPGNGRQVRVSGIQFTPAPAELLETGLLAWVLCVVNDQFRFDGITVRRTGDERTVVQFPARRDASGRKHPYVWPLGDAVRREIELQILRELGLGTEASP